MDNVLLASAAEEEYTASLCWYAERSSQAAEVFEAEFARALQAIAAHPDRYPRCDERHRYYLLNRYPFQIIYRRAGANCWLVVAVAHTSRRPQYWRDR